MAKGWSKEARAKAALARKIKARFGMAAYNAFKKSGKVPAGLNTDPNAKVLKKAPKEAKKTLFPGSTSSGGVGVGEPSRHKDSPSVGRRHKAMDEEFGAIVKDQPGKQDLGPRRSKAIPDTFDMDDPGMGKYAVRWLDEKVAQGKLKPEDTRKLLGTEKDPAQLFAKLTVMLEPEGAWDRHKISDLVKMSTGLRLGQNFQTTPGDKHMAEAYSNINGVNLMSSGNITTMRQAMNNYKDRSVRGQAKMAAKVDKTFANGGSLSDEDLKFLGDALAEFAVAPDVSPTKQKRADDLIGQVEKAAKAGGYNLKIDRPTEVSKLTRGDLDFMVNAWYAKDRPDSDTPKEEADKWYRDYDARIKAAKKRFRSRDFSFEDLSDKDAAELIKALTKADTGYFGKNEIARAKRLADLVRKARQKPGDTSGISLR